MNEVVLCEENSWLPISGLLHEWVESVPEWASSAHGQTLEDGALPCFDCVGGRCHVIRICKANSWRNSRRLMKDCLLCINWESGVVRFGLWCCGLSNGTRWDNDRNCESRFAGKLTVHHGLYVRLWFRGISLVRVYPKNPQIMQLKWFLLKQRNNFIE